MEQSALLTFGVAALVAGGLYGFAFMVRGIRAANINIFNRPSPEDRALDVAEDALHRQMMEDMGYDPALDTMLEQCVDISADAILSGILTDENRQRLVWATYRRHRIDHMARITRRTEVGDLVLSLQGLISACNLRERTPDQLRTVATSWIETANRQAIGGAPPRFAFGIPADYFLTQDVYHGLLNDPSTPADERQALMGYCVTEDDGYLLNLELIRTPNDLSRRLYNRVRARQGLPGLGPRTPSTSIQRTVPNPERATAIVSIPPRRQRRRILSDSNILHVSPIRVGPATQPFQAVREAAQEQVDSADGLVQIPPQMRQAHPIILLDDDEEPPEHAEVGQLCYMADDDMWWVCTHWVPDVNATTGDSRRVAAWQPHTPSVLDRNHLTAQLGVERAQREANAARFSAEQVAQPQRSTGLQVRNASGELVFDSAPNTAPDGVPVPFVYVRERDSRAAYQAMGADVQSQIWARILFNATGNVADMRDGAGMSWTENHQTQEYVLTYSLQGARAQFSITLETFYRTLHIAMNQHTRGDPMPTHPLIRGVPIVSAFPTTTALAGDVVYLTEDSRLYRFNGSGWEPADMLSIGAEIQAGVVTPVEITAGTVTTDTIHTPDFQNEGAPGETRDEIMARRRDAFGRPYVLCADNQWRSQEGAHAFQLEQEAAEAIRIEKLARQRRGRRRDVQ